jgi:hypothetical protein
MDAHNADIKNPFYLGRSVRICASHCVYGVAAIWYVASQKTGQTLWGCSRVGERKDGYIRIPIIEDSSLVSLHGFIEITIEQGNVFVTDGWKI